MVLIVFIVIDLLYTYIVTATDYISLLLQFLRVFSQLYHPFNICYLHKVNKMYTDT